ANHDVEVALGLRFSADFKDIFEIRGMARERRGHVLDPEAQEGAIILGYEGLDQIVRRSRLEFDPVPDVLRPDEQGRGGEAHYHLTIPAGASAEVFVTVRCTPGEPAPGTYAQTAKLVEKETRAVIA